LSIAALAAAIIHTTVTDSLIDAMLDDGRGLGLLPGSGDR
jgi:hypothetical protein